MGFRQHHIHRKGGVLVVWERVGMVGCNSWRRRDARRRPCLLFGEVNEDWRLGIGGGVRVGTILPLSLCLI